VPQAQPLQQQDAEGLASAENELWTSDSAGTKLLHDARLDIERQGPNSARKQQESQAASGQQHRSLGFCTASGWRARTRTARSVGRGFQGANLFGVPKSAP
jgi:hypothetical protein